MPEKNKTNRKHPNRKYLKTDRVDRADRENREPVFREPVFNLPNIISLSRLPILLVVVYSILINFNPLLSAILIIILFLLDILDGYVARKTGSTTKLGETIDELVDRIIELSFFILFAYLQYIPLWAPIIMLLRAFIVDGIVLHYKTKTNTNTNSPDTIKYTIKSERYNSLIRSDWSRGGYGFLKLVLFMGLVFYPAASQIYQTGLFVLAILVILFSLFRGYIKIREYLPHYY